VLQRVEQAGYPEFWQLTPQQARAQYEKTVTVLDARPVKLHKYDEGIAYAERLRAAGNRVELTRYEGMIHGFYSMSGAVDAARRALQQSADALQQAFAII
jgi:acetyl esterase/lipase